MHTGLQNQKHEHKRGLTAISAKYLEGLFRTYEMAFGALANIHEKCNIQLRTSKTSEK